MDNEVTTFGVREFSKSNSKVDAHVENILSLGYSIVPNVIDPEKLDPIRASLDRIYQKQVDECGGEDRLAIIHFFSNLMLKDLKNKHWKARAN